MSANEEKKEPTLDELDDDWKRYYAGYYANFSDPTDNSRWPISDHPVTYGSPMGLIRFEAGSDPLTAQQITDYTTRYKRNSTATAKAGIEAQSRRESR